MGDELDDIPPQKFPRHIAVIMDGNGRWAVRRGLERVRGHQQGARTVRDVVTECARLRKEHGGPDFLTLYSFSLENWKRPASEVTFLMQMYIEYLQAERQTMMENNIRFRQIGRLENLPDPVLEEVDRTLELTKANDGLTLVLALNYGSRAEIVDAVRAIAAQGAAGGAAAGGRGGADDLRPPVHGRHARPGPADPHGRRDAREQLPAVADQLRRAVRERRAVAGLRRAGAARGDPRLRRPQPPVRGAGSHQHAEVGR